MAVKVTMPRMGLTMLEGAIQTWWKKEGDRVEKGTPLFETDKALVDIEAPEGGWLRRVLVGTQQVVPVGTLVAVIGGENENISAILAEVAGPAAPGANTPAAAPAEPPKAPGVPGAKLISPRARRLPAEHGIQWQSLQGTGAEGQVTEKDVQRAFSQAGADSSPRKAPSDLVQPLSSSRQVIAQRLTESLRERVHIHLTIAVDMSAAMQMCKESFTLENAPAHVQVSINDVIVKAAAVCLMEFPHVNATLAGKEVHLHAWAHIAFAVVAEDGTLLLPVLRGAEGLRLEKIARERRVLVEKARQRRLSPEEMAGGTFTISNLGMYGVEQFTVIINPPESGILAIGAITDEPRVINDFPACAELFFRS